MTEILSAFVAERTDSSDGSQRLGKPNPAYRYLRVDVAGRAPAFLVLGYVDPHPLGDIEVWYSSRQEVIKTQNGRIVGTAGLEIDWRNVRFLPPPPAWTPPASPEIRYQRLRDEMPGYRYAVADHIVFQAWTGLPPIALPASLPAGLARTYTWFRESIVNTHSDDAPLPPAWYAWGTHRGLPTVVYSEQCLSATFCLRLQRWPVQEGAL